MILKPFKNYKTAVTLNRKTLREECNFLFINRQRKDVQPKYPRHLRFSRPRDPHPRVTNTSERREQFTAAFGFTGSF
jgi:hypothetical protein